MFNLPRRSDHRRDEIAEAEARLDEAHANLKAAMLALLAERNRTVGKHAEKRS